MRRLLLALLLLPALVLAEFPGAFPSTMRIAAHDGTAALPSYAFSTQADLGMYIVGSDALGFSSNGVLRATVDNSGLTINSGALYNSGSGDIVTNGTLIRSSVGTATLQITGADATNLGGNLLLYGDAEGADGGDFILRSDAVEIIEYDLSGLDLFIGHTDTDIQFDGDALGFFGTTPVAKQANIAAAAGTDAALIDAIVAALEAYGLLATS